MWSLPAVNLRSTRSQHSPVRLAIEQHRHPFTPSRRPQIGRQVKVTYHARGGVYARSRGPCSRLQLIFPSLCPELPRAQTRVRYTSCQPPLVYPRCAPHRQHSMASRATASTPQAVLSTAYFHLNPQAISRLPGPKSRANPILATCAHGCKRTAPTRAYRAASRVIEHHVQTFERNIREQLAVTLAKGDSIRHSTSPPSP